MSGPVQKAQLLEEAPSPRAKPFVKWAGGKGALVRSLAHRLKVGEEHRRYIEPFVGAGALFFHLQAHHPELEFKIADSNAELCNAYRAVRDQVGELVNILEFHQQAHGTEHYYEVRSRVPHSPVEQAARFIYLNRTCFNGLYRVNRKGQFNVPIGRYASPAIAQRDRLLAVSRALVGVEIETSDFEAAVADAGRGDLVYFDPPYDPVSKTSQFTGYTQIGFDRLAQTRLAYVFAALASKGVRVVLSNSDTPFIRELYRGLKIGPKIEGLDVARSINSRASGRGPVRELLISHPGL